MRDSLRFFHAILTLIYCYPYWHARRSSVGAKTGGDERGRTADLMNAIHALYQLSYIPIYIFKRLFISYYFSYIKVKDLKQNGKHLIT